MKCNHSCEHCSYSSPIEYATKMFLCRYHAPKVERVEEHDELGHLESTRFVSVWPRVGSDDWCRHFSENSPE